MCVHWYFAKHFLELSYCLFSKFKNCILDKLDILFKLSGFNEYDLICKWLVIYFTLKLEWCKKNCKPMESPDSRRMTT